MRNICVTYTGQIASGEMGIGRLGAGMTEGEVHHNPAWVRIMKDCQVSFYL